MGAQPLQRRQPGNVVAVPDGVSFETAGATPVAATLVDRLQKEVRVL